MADGALSANLRGLLGGLGLEGSGSGPPFVQRVWGSASFGIGNQSGRRSVGKRNESHNIRNNNHWFEQADVCFEGCFPLVSIMNTYVIVSPLDIQLRKEC